MGFESWIFIHLDPDVMGALVERISYGSKAGRIMRHEKWWNGQCLRKYNIKGYSLKQWRGYKWNKVCLVIYTYLQTIYSSDANWKADFHPSVSKVIAFMLQLHELGE